MATADGTLSVTAVAVPLARVLTRIGEVTHTRFVIETVLAEELARARVDVSFTRVPAAAALRRLLSGYHYVMMFSPTGVDEVRVYRNGTTGYVELAPDPARKGRPTSLPLADWPADDPIEVTRLRQTALGGPDTSARADALMELSNIRDTALLIETLTQVLDRERDRTVLQAAFEVAAQQTDRISPAALRTFAASDRDGAARALALELLADQSGDDPATRSLLRTLAANDASAAVREAAGTALGHLEGPPPRPASELPSSKGRTSPARP